MGKGAITQYVDVAQIVLYLFWIFFAGLIYYLIRDGHREGYPMVSDGDGWIEGWPPTPSPKTAPASSPARSTWPGASWSASTSS